MIINNKQSGFTLVEIAIVLLVVTILLGYTVALFPIQQELKQYRKADREMNEIIEHLIGFAQVNGRLPCPDTRGILNGGIIDGQEDIVDVVVNATGAIAASPADNIPDGCLGYFGFIPAGTIGMTGSFAANGQLLDPWGVGYGYHVSNFSANTIPTTPSIDLVTPNGVREEGLANVIPDLNVCSTSLNAAATDLTCAAGTTFASNVAVVITSLGKNGLTNFSNIEAENFDGFHNGTLDKVYVSTARNDSVANSYNDIVKWISPSLLFSKMIEADQLP